MKVSDLLIVARQTLFFEYYIQRVKTLIDRLQKFLKCPREITDFREEHSFRGIIDKKKSCSFRIQKELRDAFISYEVN